MKIQSIKTVYFSATGNTNIKTYEYESILEWLNIM